MKITFLSPDLISPYLPKYFSGPLGWVEGAIAPAWIRHCRCHGYGKRTMSRRYHWTSAARRGATMRRVRSKSDRVDQKPHISPCWCSCVRWNETFYQNVVKVPERLRIKLRLQFCAPVECFLQIGSISSVSKLENFDFSVLYKCIAQKNQNSQRAAVSRP